MLGFQDLSASCILEQQERYCHGTSFDPYLVNSNYWRHIHATQAVDSQCRLH